jgi:outer membrane protein TolC
MVCVTIALGRSAGGVEDLTLRQAMARARVGAHEVRAAAARSEAGGARLREARSHRKPKVRLQEIWTRTDSPAEAFGLVLNQERFSLAEFSTGNPNDPKSIENALTRIEVELPIYTGGELSGRIRQAELATAASRQSAVWIEDQAAWATAEAYVRLTQIQENRALLDVMLDTIDAHVELARAYVEQGLLVRSELLRAEVERARINDLVTEARGLEHVAEANLAYQLGAPEAQGWTLEPLPDPEPLVEPLEEWLATAEGRFDLAAARSQLEAGELEESVRRSLRLPRIGLLARHDRFDDSPFGASGDSNTIMAVASIDLFSGGRHRAAVESARFEAGAARLDVERFREGVRLEVRQAYVRAVTARERQVTAAAALVAAREAERIIRERFENGIAKTLDVLDALSAHHEAETRESVARGESHLALLRLAVLSGRRPESVIASAFEDSSQNASLP